MNLKTLAERQLQIKMEICRISQSIDTCHPNDRDFYCEILCKYSLYLKKLQRECSKVYDKDRCNV